MKPARQPGDRGRAGRVLLCGVLICLAAAPAGATVYQGDPSSYRSLIPTLLPGDVLELEAGSYTQGLPLTDLVGEAGSPIVITGPKTGSPAVLLGDGSRNTVSIRRSAYVAVRYLTLDGLSIANVDAVKAEGDSGNWSHHIEIGWCTIVNHDPNQQTVGISTKSPAWDWWIHHNVIHSAGTGLYLGNSNGEAAFIRGLVEYNLVLNPEGYCMQIKHQNPRPSLPDMPPDGSVTVIRHNVFIKDDDPSGSGDRPNLLIGHLPLSGVGQNDRYEIYGNLFFHNPREALFQGEGNLHFHDNILVDAGRGWPAVNIRPHNDVPREIFVYHNTLYAADTGITVTGVDPSETQAVFGNAIFATTALNLAANVTDTDNVTDTAGNAGTYVTSPGVDLATLDLYPLAGQLTGAALDMSAVSGDLDVDRDFNGTPRDHTFRGAYHGGQASNPGWHLAAEIKGETQVTPLPDGGVGPDSGPPSDGATGPDSGGGADAGPDPSNGDDGCGCRAAGDEGGPGLALLFLLLGCGLRRRARSSA